MILVFSCFFGKLGKTWSKLGKTWQNLVKVGRFLQLFELKQKSIYLKSIAVLACSGQRIADRKRLKARAKTLDIRQ